MSHDHFAYGVRKTVALAPADAEARLRELLAGEGFGILTEIDIPTTFRAKLDVDFKPYRILGACNPPIAHQALTQEEDIGLLLPCNVVVREGDTPGESVVAILDPKTQLAMTGRTDIEPLAEEVTARLHRVIEAL